MPSPQIIQQPPGLKSVNSDKEFMFLLKKFGFDPTELATYPDDVFDRLGAPTSKGGSGMRDLAQLFNKIERQGYMNGKLGMIIDSTGGNFKKVKRQKKMLEDAGYEELIEPRGDYSPFSEVGNIEKDFIRLDKSFKYSPILQIRDNPELDDCMYYYEEEHSYLATKKSEYSFLLGVDSYNSNFDLKVIEVFKNIKKKDIKKLSQKVLKNHHKTFHYCKWIILNNSYIWGSDSEYKALMSKKILPPSLKKFFLPILKNKIKFFKDFGNKPSDIKKINSAICIINENRIKKKTSFWEDHSFPFTSKLVKGEVCEYLLNPNQVWSF